MSDDLLDDLLAQLGGRLDRASHPSEAETAMLSAAPRQVQRRPARHVRMLSVAGVAAAAAVVIVAVATLAAWPERNPSADLTTGTEPPVPHLRIDDAGPVVDGQSVTVVGDGFKPNRTVVLHQCSGDRCDAWRPGVVVEADDSGTFTTPFVLYRDIAPERSERPGLPTAIDWQSCEPCSLRAEGVADLDLPVTIAASDAPLHPTVQLTPPGPYSPGQRVQVEGMGFQPDPDGLEVGVAYCPSAATRFEECGGGPELGDFVVRSDGTFVIEDFELPGPTTQLGDRSCVERPGACTLSWFLYAPGPLPPGVPLDLSN